MFQATTIERVPSEAPSTSTAWRIKALREALNLTQEALAAVCPGLTRVEINQLESGRNKGTSWATREALAVGADVPTGALAAYLDGQIDLPGLLAVQGTRTASEVWRSFLARKYPPSNDK